MINLPLFRFDYLNGKRHGTYVLTNRFDSPDALSVNLEEYH